MDSLQVDLIRLFQNSFASESQAILGLLKTRKERNILIVIKVSEKDPEWTYLSIRWK